MNSHRSHRGSARRSRRAMEFEYLKHQTRPQPFGLIEQHQTDWRDELDRKHPVRVR